MVAQSRAGSPYCSSRCIRSARRYAHPAGLVCPVLSVFPFGDHRRWKPDPFQVRHDAACREAKGCL